MQEQKYNDIIIAGHPRSGTSWLRDIVSSAKGVFIYNEPDLQRNKKKSMLSRLRAFIIKDEAGQDNSRLLLEGMEQLHSLEYIASGLKSNLSLFWGKVFCRINRIGFKTIDSLYRLGWMRKNLNYPKTILVIRNPFGTVCSQLKFIAKSNPRDKVYIPSELTSAINFEIFSPVQLVALSWKLGYDTCLKENKDTPNFKVVVYEELCKDPMNISKDMFKFLELEFTDRTSAFIEKSTNPGYSFISKISSKRFYSTTKNPAESVNKWKKLLTQDQKNEIFNIVKDSELMQYWPNIASQ